MGFFSYKRATLPPSLRILASSLFILHRRRSVVRRPLTSRGFTLVELLVVLLIIVVLVALLLPWVGRHSHGPALRMVCSNNVKQLSLGLQNYHDTFLCFPSGARCHTTPLDSDQASFGPSWLVATLPFCEQRPLYDKLAHVDSMDAASDYQSAALRQVANKAIIKYLICPSSKLPTSEQLSGAELVLPSYAGIMGANRYPSNLKIDALDPQGRIVAGPYGGFAAANGMLPINEWLTMNDCADGSANVIIVGEVADWYYNDRGQRLNPALAVGNAGLGQNAAAGWLAGTDLDYPIVAGAPAVGADRVFNLITIEHPVGITNRLGQRDADPNWGTRGIGRCGLNNPLTSFHPAGAMVGFVDGHVRLIAKQTDLKVLKQLAGRADGGVDPEF